MRARLETEDSLNGSRNIAHLVEIDVHARELEIGGSIIPRLMREEEGCWVAIRMDCLHATAIQTMLARNGLPEGRADLVALLRLAHGMRKKRTCNKKGVILTHWPACRCTYREEGAQN
jgi:hypothetical protein